MLVNYLQQMTSADDIFRCIFFLGALSVSVEFVCIEVRVVRLTCCPDMAISVEWGISSK